MSASTRDLYPSRTPIQGSLQAEKQGISSVGSVSSRHLAGAVVEHYVPKYRKRQHAKKSHKKALSAVKEIELFDEQQFGLGRKVRRVVLPSKMQFKEHQAFAESLECQNPPPSKRPELGPSCDTDIVVHGPSTCQDPCERVRATETGTRHKLPPRSPETMPKQAYQHTGVSTRPVIGKPQSNLVHEVRLHNCTAAKGLQLDSSEPTASSGPEDLIRVNDPPSAHIHVARQIVAPPIPDVSALRHYLAGLDRNQMIGNGEGRLACLTHHPSKDRDLSTSQAQSTAMNIALAHTATNPDIVRIGSKYHQDEELFESSTSSCQTSSQTHKLITHSEDGKSTLSDTSPQNEALWNRKYSGDLSSSPSLSDDPVKHDDARDITFDNLSACEGRMIGQSNVLKETSRTNPFVFEMQRRSMKEDPKASATLNTSIIAPACSQSTNTPTVWEIPKRVLPIQKAVVELVSQGSSLDIAAKPRQVTEERQTTLEQEAAEHTDDPTSNAQSPACSIKVQITGDDPVMITNDCTINTN